MQSLMDFCKEKPRRLVISSGDVSDVDGFYALAEYRRAGLDVVFVMNYPATVGEPQTKQEELETGLGFRYGAQAVLARPTPKQPLLCAAVERLSLADDVAGAVGALADAKLDAYSSFLQRYKGEECNAKFRQALTDMALELATSVWAGSDARLYFAIGGVNSVNPFALSALKNELYVYATVMKPAASNRVLPTEGAVYCASDLSQQSVEALLSGYEEIYWDFAGSAAYFTPDVWGPAMRRHAKKIKGALTAASRRLALRFPTAACCCCSRTLVGGRVRGRWAWLHSRSLPGPGASAAAAVCWACLSFGMPNIYA